MIVFRKDEIWSADLVDMQAFSSVNKGFKYILTVIDVFSKYAWAIPLKNKTGISVTKAFEKIIGERIPKKLWVDEGKEFYNSTFIKFLDQHKINMYSTFNEGKAVVIERFNRTLKRIMWKYFTTNNTRKYIDVLPEMIKNYNEKVHSTIKMSPNEASKAINRGKVYFNIIKNRSKAGKSIKYKKGDKVRISKYKKKFEKGYTPNWTEEIFTIDKINRTYPITYQVKDLNNDKIFGSFYEQELSPAKQEIFRIEKVIRRDNKNKKALVKWVGYTDKHNSWVPFSDLINL
ncbi:MAG: DDE-type integrase/transposase/recombinase [gamma proteobacterium symbiont of Bathyaustriella thionipta]|nr:DDE-type integrase/transposase/recombinase [gamma proteobacterium symbiont of Bathyaustriella thionipta]